jgi:hypothetical protein
LTADAGLTHDCAAHDAYMAGNGVLTHVEAPGSPGYTPGGAYAGLNSVLTQGPGWTWGDPYDSAPLHLDQLLAPRLLTVGSADLDGYSCTTTFPGWTRPAPTGLTVYTFPGKGGVIASQETASEQPYAPGQLVGIPAGTTTGPYLLVFVDAPGQSPFDNAATLTGATLTGPSGPAPIVVVDGATPIPGGTVPMGSTGTTGASGTTGTTGVSPTLAPYISPGGFIIPTSPLQPGAIYTAHVVIGFAGVQTPYTWQFMANGRDPRSSLVANGSRLSFNSMSPQPVTVTFVSAGGGHAQPVTIEPSQAAALDLPPGDWTACGSQAATGSFAAYQHCIALTVTGVPVLTLGAGRVSGNRLRFPLRFSAVLRGRSATLTVTPLLRSCARGSCRTRNGVPTSRSFVLSSSTLSLAAPPHGNGVEVQLSTTGFQLNQAPYTAARGAARYLRR